MLGKQVVALPDAAHAARRDGEALQPQILLDPERAVAGMIEHMGEHGLFDLGGNPVWDAVPWRRVAGRSGLRRHRSGSCAGSRRTAGGIAHHLAGAADIGKFARKVEQRQLATCHLVLRSHVRCLRI